MRELKVGGVTERDELLAGGRVGRIALMGLWLFGWVRRGGGRVGRGVGLFRFVEDRT